jgi:hypothetical protein
MTVTRQDLVDYYLRLNDDELRRMLASDELTPLATEVAGDELRRRGIEVSEATAEGPPMEQAEARSGNLILLARFLSPMEAEMARGRLTAEGVEAVIADAQIVQMTALMPLAFGGVRVLVPELQLPRAREILKAIEAGEPSPRDPTEVG